MPVHNLQDADEVRNTLTENKIVLIDYFATWCEESKTIAPVFAEQSNRDDYQNIKFAKVDVDELKELVEEFGVTSTPTVQLFKNGQRVDECVTPGPHALLQFIAHAQE